MSVGCVLLIVGVVLGFVCCALIDPRSDNAARIDAKSTVRFDIALLVRFLISVVYMVLGFNLLFAFLSFISFYL